MMRRSDGEKERVQSFVVPRHTPHLHGRNQAKETRVPLTTHVLAGWCLGNLLRLTPRQRVLCVVAAVGPDIDGLGWVVSWDVYWDYHHLLAHNFSFALVAAAVLAAWSYPQGRLGLRTPLLFLLYLGLVHLHLLMDYFGAGWPLWYEWPFTRRQFVSVHCWGLLSWENLGITVGLAAWTVWIAVRRGRTPFEAVMPAWDRECLKWLERRAGWMMKTSAMASNT
jgi:hypothetical protein